MTFPRHKQHLKLLHFSKIWIGNNFCNFPKRITMKGLARSESVECWGQKVGRLNKYSSYNFCHHFFTCTTMNWTPQRKRLAENVSLLFECHDGRLFSWLWVWPFGTAINTLDSVVPHNIPPRVCFEPISQPLLQNQPQANKSAFYFKSHNGCLPWNPYFQVDKTVCISRVCCCW